MNGSSIRPLEHLREFEVLLPGLMKKVDSYRRELMANGFSKENARYCFLPASSAVAAMSNRFKLSQEEFIGAFPSPEFFPIFSALAAWRLTKSIYYFDKDVMRYVADSTIAGNIPAESLFRLPEWCVYIRTPGMNFYGRHVFGFYAFLDLPESKKAVCHDYILTMVIDLGSLGSDKGPIATSISLSCGSLEDCIYGYEKSIEHICPPSRKKLSKSDVDRHAEQIRPFISLLLYLCSQPEEIVGDVGSPRAPSPVKKAGGMGYREAKKVKDWNVGVRTGGALRLAYERIAKDELASGDGPSIRQRPHVRRAHWHGFWKGSKAPGREDERTFELKWLPPIPVNVSDADNLPAVIKRVDQDTRKGMK